jgi:DNA repair protein RadD
MQLRQYQKDAVDSLMRELHPNTSKNPVMVLATGAGKSLIIAEIARILAKPILIIQPTKEILEQNLEKLLEHIDRDEIGIFSASMDEKIIKKYTLATIQSIYKIPEKFAHFGLVVVDECDLLNPKDTGTMFESFLTAIGNPRVIGLTATPYRQDHMTINYGEWNQERITTTKIITRMKGQREKAFWNSIICNVTMEFLMEQGFLCRPKYFNNASLKHEDIPMNKSMSEFDLEQYEILVQKEEHKIMDAVARAQAISKSVLVFCISVEQAHRFKEVVKGAEVVSARTNAKERKRIVDGFKAGTIQTVFNVGCFTTGFDHPQLDAIICVRPTNSIRLWVQMVGRGVRIAEGKEFCRVIDFSGNLKRFGRVETVKLVKRGMWELESETCTNWHCKVLKYY